MLRKVFMFLIALALAVPALTLAQGDAAPIAPAATVTTGEDFTVTVAPPEITELTTDPGFGVKYTKERVIKLPKDGQKFFVTVIGDPNDSKFIALKSWFKDVPELAKLRDETHFNAVATNRPDFKEKFSKNVPNTPLVRVQTSNGGVIYQVSGDNVPMSGQALSRSINTEFLRRWRERHLDRNNNGNGNDKNNADDSAVDNEDDDADVLSDDNADRIPDTQPAVLDQLPDGLLLVLAGLLGVIAVGGYTVLRHAKANQTIKF